MMLQYIWKIVYLKENNQNLYRHKILENMWFVAYKTSGIFGYYNTKAFYSSRAEGEL